MELFHTTRCIFIGMQNLQNAQPRQQRLDTDQDQHNAADALGGGTVLVAEQGTDLHADGRQVITPISPAAGRMSTCMAAKLTPTANASMLVAMASGSMALAE